MAPWLLVIVTIITAGNIISAASIEENSPAMYDTIIVGLGASGASAASTLARAGRRVLVLEAQGRVGGRVCTVPFGDGVVEMGAEWIHGQTPSSVYDLAMQNNVSIISQEISMEVYSSDGSKGDAALVNELIGFALQACEQPPAEPQPLGQYITSRLMDYIKDNHPYLLKDQAYISDLLTFTDLVIDSYEATTSWNDVTTESKYRELEGDQHLSWHRNGYKTLFEILLNTYKNGTGLPTLEYKLNKEVTQINWSQEPNKKVTVKCKDGAEYTADNVIVTVSIGVLKARHSTLFNPGLPQAKLDAIHNIHMGLLGKIILKFEKQWWPSNSSFYGFWWKGQDRLAVADVLITKFGFASRPMGASNVLTIWTHGDNGRWLPPAKIKSIETISIGVMNKIVLLFPYAWWPKDSNVFGFLWKKSEKEKMLEGDRWISQIFGCSTPLGAANALTLWTCGDTGRKIETLPDDVVKSKAMELLRRFLGTDRTIPEPIDMIRSSWNSNPYTLGSYSYDHVDSYQHPTARVDLAQPITDAAGKPKLLFAGEATDPSHFSTVHGAVDSGKREAMRLLPKSKM